MITLPKAIASGTASEPAADWMEEHHGYCPGRRSPTSLPVCEHLCTASLSFRCPNRTEQAVIRVMRLLNQSADIPVLAPLITEEIRYRVLQSFHCAALVHIAAAGSQASRINDVIDYLMHHFAESLRAEDLADMAHMSVSSLHRTFKTVTAISRIQFQKTLQEARRLLVSETTGAADVAVRAGYESPSQFSREYTRMFGFPPRHDIRSLRAAYEPAFNQ